MPDPFENFLKTTVISELKQFNIGYENVVFNEIVTNFFRYCHRYS